jgi:hypothetical protein
MACKPLRWVGCTALALALCASPASAHRSFVYVTNGQSISEYSIGAGGRLSPLSPPAFQTPHLLSVGLAATPDGPSVYAASDGDLVRANASAQVSHAMRHCVRLRTGW